MNLKFMKLGTIFLIGTQITIRPVLSSPVAAKFPGVAELNCVDETQIGLNRCAVYWSKTTEFLRSLVYEQRLQELANRDRSTFRNAERYWQAYRESHCNESIEPFRSGSMSPMVYHRCLAKLNNDRLADLNGIDPNYSESAAESSSTNVALDRTKTQQLWNRYRVEYCKFETAFFGNSTRSKECPNRLAKMRLRHHKEMMDLR